MTQDTLEKIGHWIVSDDTGISSRFLCAVALGIKVWPEKMPFQYPLDPSDFGRCYRFLQILPVEDQMTTLLQAGKLSPQWEKIAEHWNEMVRLYEEEKPTGRAPKLYQLMKDLGL